MDGARRMKFLSELFWSIAWLLYFRRRVVKCIVTMSLHEFNLVEAKMHADGVLTPEIEQFFAEVRPLKALAGGAR
jgi:hypothetical protein